MTNITNPPWQNRAIAQAVLAALAAAGITARFVGGCVRDALLNIATNNTDLDMATPVAPDAVMAALTAAGIRAVPTGIAFGTVTAVGDGGDKIEITTLRRDIDTDGRHATVAFGTDWAQDAQRRDFTINALYADADGVVHDYGNGLDDLRARRVRFIGDATTRITEDYLRIMRFYRFSARFADTLDETGHAACGVTAAGMDRLARERVWMELAKILTLSEPVRALQPMAEAGVLQRVLPDMAYHFAVLARLADYEHDNRVVPVPIVRLQALVGANTGRLHAALLLSNREQDWLRLCNASVAAGDMRALRKVWYVLGDIIATQPVWLHSVALRLLAEDDAAGSGTGDNPQWPTDVFALATAWQTPVFPLAGADVLALGVSAGPRVGDLLAQVEAWWLENDFKPKRDECLAQLRSLI